MKMTSLLKIFEKEDSINTLVSKLTEPEKESVRAALGLIVNQLSNDEDKKSKEEIKKLESKLISLQRRE